MPALAVSWDGMDKNVTISYLTKRNNLCGNPIVLTGASHLVMDWVRYRTLYKWRHLTATRLENLVGYDQIFIIFLLSDLLGEIKKINEFIFMMHLIK